MKFAVETWSPDYGAPSSDDTLAQSVSDVDAFVEARRPEAWVPRRPGDGAGALDGVLFVDGVRRVEANVWITTDDGQTHQGICASYAAGGVFCDGVATVVGPLVRRGLFCTAPDAQPIRTAHAHFALHGAGPGQPADLTLLLQDEMARLEVEVARRSHAAATVVVVDGPLRAGHAEPGGAGPAATSGVALVGYVKTHNTSYGPPIVADTVGRLAVGERTPVFCIGGRRPRYSWYLRLPCDVLHGWAGVVRLEALATHTLDEIVSFADCLAVTLPRFASAPQKDPRAPQNLYPIGGLERELRRRLGDPALLFRALCAAARAPSVAAASS